MDAESAFNIVGNFGRYQILLSSLAFLGNFIFSLQMVLMVIVGANVTIPNETNMTTIVSDFDLYDKKWIVELMQSLLMAGFMIGCLIFGQISDSYGRRIPFLVCGFSTSLISLCSGLTTMWQTFAATRFLTGFFMGGTSVIMFVLLTEYVGRKAWAAVGIVYQIFFSFGICFLGFLGYVIPKWQHVCMVAGGLALFLVFVASTIIPESPRWLYATGQIQKAEKLLQQMAWRNGQNGRDIQLVSVVESRSTHTVMDLFKYKKLAIRITVMCFLWFSNALIYYGLTLSSGDLMKNLFLGIILDGVVEIPANIFCIFAMNWKRLGRKGTVGFLFFLCGVCCLLLMFISDINGARITLGLTSKLAIAGSFNSLYVYNGELFPTPLRTIALGLSSTTARFGAITAPFVGLINNGNGFTAYLIYGIFAAISLAFLFFTPRTVGKPIPQTIEEVIIEDGYKVIVNEEEANSNLVDDKPVLYT